MKKCLSLVFSLLTSFAAFAGVTYDNAFWIIKDGKVADGISTIPYTDLGTKVPDEMVETTVDGEDVVEYHQISKNFLDVKLMFDAAHQLDLTKNYILVLEYKIPAAHAENKLIDGNKPLFIFGFGRDTAAVNISNAPHCELYVTIDAKWGETDKWVTATKYMFANPDFTTAGGMIFSYAREYVEGDMSEFPYIKNMAIVSYDEGVKPFYAENFDGYGVGEFYLESINPLTFKGNKYYSGGIAPVVTDDDSEYLDDEGLPTLCYFRDFQPDSVRDQDGSGFIDDELLHALRVENFRSDSIMYPGIAIPEGSSKIYASLLAKRMKKESKRWSECDYSEVANEDIPILLKFNTGEEVNLANDTIKETWTRFYGEIDVPEGATSADLIFKPMCMGYFADEVVLSAVKYAQDGIAKIFADNHDFDINAYVDGDGNIVVLNGTITAMYNLSGRRACQDDKIVVIVVENENGQHSSRIMMR